MISCSRDGLSVTEMMLMLPGMSWYQWLSHIKLLTSLKILKEQAGLYRPHNTEVAIIHLKLSISCRPFIKGGLSDFRGFCSFSLVFV